MFPFSLRVKLAFLRFGPQYRKGHSFHRIMTNSFLPPQPTNVPLGRSNHISAFQSHDKRMQLRIITPLHMTHVCGPPLTSWQTTTFFFLGKFLVGTQGKRGIHPTRLALILSRLGSMILLDKANRNPLQTPGRQSICQ